MRTAKWQRAATAAAVLLAVALVDPLVPAASSAAPVCVPDRDATARLCAELPAKMYGVFSTFIHTPFTYAAGSEVMADAFNETRVYTADNKSTSFSMGLHVTNSTGGARFQPYWANYGPSYQYFAIAPISATADGKNHTYTASPVSSGNKAWDIFYDFEKVGRTTGQVNAGYSNYLFTGWDVAYELAKSAFPQTTNYIQYKTGNGNWLRFAPTQVTASVAQGNCAPGSDPLFCFRFTTQTLTRPAPDNSVTAWRASKAVVRPGLQSEGKTAPRTESSPAAPAASQQPMTREAALAAATSLQRKQGTAPRTAPAEMTAQLLTVAAYRQLMPDTGKMPAPTNRNLWVVSSPDLMPTISGDHELKQGFTLAFDQTTHQLLHACLGSGCEVPRA